MSILVCFADILHSNEISRGRLDDIEIVQHMQIQQCRVISYVGPMICRDSRADLTSCIFQQVGNLQEIPF